MTASSRPPTSLLHVILLPQKGLLCLSEVNLFDVEPRKLLVTHVRRFEMGNASFGRNELRLISGGHHDGPSDLQPRYQ